jgi:hypothetical protein
MVGDLLNASKGTAHQDRNPAAGSGTSNVKGLRDRLPVLAVVLFITAAVIVALTEILLRSPLMRPQELFGVDDISLVRTPLLYLMMFLGVLCAFALGFHLVVRIRPWLVRPATLSSGKRAFIIGLILMLFIGSFITLESFIT